MNSDDETFFEDEDVEEDATFPDEDIEDDEDIEEDLDEEVDYKEVRSYGDTSVSSLSKFLADPWPPTVFILTVIGLGMVLLTPHEIWAPNRYGIIGVYFLLVAALAGIVFSLITWQRAGTHRLRWAGPVNIIVILAAVVVGVLDTISWIFTGASMIPLLESPLILLCFMLVFFSLYMLWMIQRSLDPEAR